MSTMRMPGFTADRSVYASSGPYRSIAAGRAREGGGVIPAQEPCLPIKQICSACTPTGPSLFRGRQFCQTFTCQQTFGGGCRCRLLSKGFVSCRPFDLGGGGIFTSQ
jgi:hypothetical protein